MKKPFSYYGGKRYLSKRICAMLPPHKVYCEPFCGGASVFFAKDVPEVKNKDHYREVLNDTNGSVVEVFRALRDHGEELRKRVMLIPYSEREYRRAVRVYRGVEEELNAVERAALLLLFWTGSRAGKANGGMKRSRSGGNTANTWANKEAMIPMFTARLRGVFVEDTDALTCIKRWDSVDTLFYLDPPYPGCNQGHYGGWGDEDHERLCDALEDVEGTFLLSGYDHSAPNSRGWERIGIESVRQAGNSSRGKTLEYVWTNKQGLFS